MSRLYRCWCNGIQVMRESRQSEDYGVLMYDQILNPDTTKNVSNVVGRIAKMLRVWVWDWKCPSGPYFFLWYYFQSSENLYCFFVRLSCSSFSLANLPWMVKLISSSWLAVQLGNAFILIIQSLNMYSGIPFFCISKGNENCVEKSSGVINRG